MAMARLARKNPRKVGRGHCGGRRIGKGKHYGKGYHGKGMHGKGMRGMGMHGMGLLKKLKKATRRSNVRKLMNTAIKVADVASVLATTDKNKARAQSVASAARGIKKKDKQVRKAVSG